MKVVSRFEAHLLRILHFFFGRVPGEQALPLLLAAHPQPRCLGAAAVGLVEDTLAKGATLFLARTGGWRRERHVRGEQVAEGRLWERTPPAELGLPFSRHALGFLVVVTATKLPEDGAWQVPAAKLTAGDWLLLFLAHRALRQVESTRPLRAAPALAGNALCRLAYPEDFAAEQEVPDFAPWTTGLGACVIEALHPLLAERWLTVERDKRHAADWRQLRDVGRSQERVLEAFLGAVETAGRLDLARFLLRALSRLLTPDAGPEMWGAAVARTGPRMADRAEATQAALALLRQAERFQRWERRARGVGYFDEGYAAGQLTKTDWERAGGDDLLARAQAILRATDPMRAV